MPWTSDSLDNLIQTAINLIFYEFQIKPNATILICDSDELIKAVLNEFKKKKKSSHKMDYYKKVILPKLLAKYFSESNEIWLIEGKGDQLPIIIHELIHSIQKCGPNRENIVDFIVYKMTNDKKYIDENVIKEWQEIEKQIGYENIKVRILHNGDCEAF